MGLRDMWLEFRAELEGMRRVLLAGALAGALAPALVLVMGFFLVPLPLALASAHYRRSDRSGPAIALGALLGYLLVIALMVSPLYPPYYRWLTRGMPVRGVERIFMSYRACSPFLSGLFVTFLGWLMYMGDFASPSFLTLVPIAWVTLSAYPAYIARSRFRRVPRLLLIMYSLALLANALACALCLPVWLEEPPLFSALAALDPAASVTLAAACLWRARRGGGQNLLAFLTFLALLGTPRCWWWWSL